MWAKNRTDPERIEVPEAVIRRARQIPVGTEGMWIDATLGQIGGAATHHRAGDPLLDEAIMGAEALLALLHEMRRRER